MKEINLPLPKQKENEPIEINVNIGNNRIIENFRVESFYWENPDELAKDKDFTTVSLARIVRLKKSIESYDKSWELVQIFAPLENSDFVRVLYRKRNK